MHKLGISSVTQMNLWVFFKRRRNSEYAFCISTELDAALFTEMETGRPVWHRDKIYL